jgi:hypothetical protein
MKLWALPQSSERIQSGQASSARGSNPQSKTPSARPTWVERARGTAVLCERFLPGRASFQLLPSSEVPHRVLQFHML